ncbi:MAG: serine hydrolase [Victivallaceae bacterium]|nr:serine hydrolase [Victivallaceae bacterium]
MSAYQDEIAAEIADGVIDGAVVCAGDRTGIKRIEHFGFADRSGGVPMRDDSIFDVASITKVIAVAPALRLLGVDMDRPFTDYIDFHAALIAPVTVRDLATHISGFALNGGPIPYFSEDGRAMMRDILRRPPIFPPRTRYEYACWNFLLLGAIVEKVSGEPLNTFCRHTIFAPLKMNDTSLGRPVTDDISRLARTFAMPHAGEISDPTSFRIYRDGLCAGNAGAFTTAPDLAKFNLMLLNGGAPLLNASDIAEFSTNTIPAALHIKRGVGFLIDDPFKPTGFPARTVYHSGWSGQTMIADLENGFFAIVLTARQGDYDRAKRGRFAMLGDLHGQFMRNAL